VKVSLLPGENDIISYPFYFYFYSLPPRLFTLYASSRFGPSNRQEDYKQAELKMECMKVAVESGKVSLLPGENGISSYLFYFYIFLFSTLASSRFGLLQIEHACYKSSVLVTNRARLLQSEHDMATCKQVELAAEEQRRSLFYQVRTVLLVIHFIYIYFYIFYSLFSLSASSRFGPVFIFIYLIMLIKPLCSGGEKGTRSVGRQ
jgi:hypothetical protein